MNLIHSITLKDYPSHFKLSEKAQAKYYKLGDKILNKHLNAYNNLFRDFKGVRYLTNIETGERVIKNENLVGKPRLKPINGQILFNTSGDAYQTNKCLTQIKEWFYSQWTIDDLLIMSEATSLQHQWPLILRFIYKCPRTQIEDIDNLRILYEKAIIDALKSFKYERKTNKDKLEKVTNFNGFLPDDNVSYISRVSSEWEESKERKLIIMFYTK